MDSEDAPCLHCDDYVRAYHQAITCDSCGGWQHRACGYTGVSRTMYERMMTEDIEVSFICDRCSTSTQVSEVEKPGEQSFPTTTAAKVKHEVTGQFDSETDIQEKQRFPRAAKSKHSRLSDTQTEALDKLRSLRAAKGKHEVTRRSDPQIDNQDKKPTLRAVKSESDVTSQSGNQKDSPEKHRYSRVSKGKHDFTSRQSDTPDKHRFPREIKRLKATTSPSKDIGIPETHGNAKATKHVHVTETDSRRQKANKSLLDTMLTDENADIMEDNGETIADNSETVEDNSELRDTVSIAWNGHIMLIKESMEDNSESTGDNGETMRDNSEIIDDNSESITNNNESMGDFSETMGDNSETMGDNSERLDTMPTGENAHNMLIKETTEDKSKTTGDNSETMGNNSETTGDNSETIADNNESMGNNNELVATKSKSDIEPVTVDMSTHSDDSVRKESLQQDGLKEESHIDVSLEDMIDPRLAKALAVCHEIEQRTLEVKGNIPISESDTTPESIDKQEVEGCEPAGVKPIANKEPAIMEPMANKEPAIMEQRMETEECEHATGQSIHTWTHPHPENVQAAFETTSQTCDDSQNVLHVNLVLNTVTAPLKTKEKGKSQAFTSKTREPELDTEVAKQMKQELENILIRYNKRDITISEENEHSTIEKSQSMKKNKQTVEEIGHNMASVNRREQQWTERRSPIWISETDRLHEDILNQQSQMEPDVREMSQKAAEKLSHLSEMDCEVTRQEVHPAENEHHDEITETDQLHDDISNQQSQMKPDVLERLERTAEKISRWWAMDCTISRWWAMDCTVTGQAPHPSENVHDESTASVKEAAVTQILPQTTNLPYNDETSHSIIEMPTPTKEYTQKVKEIVNTTNIVRENYKDPYLIEKRPAAVTWIAMKDYLDVYENEAILNKQSQMEPELLERLQEAAERLSQEPSQCTAEMDHTVTGQTMHPTKNVQYENTPAKVEPELGQTLPRELNVSHEDETSHRSEVDQPVLEQAPTGVESAYNREKRAREEAEVPKSLPRKLNVSYDDEANPGSETDSRPKSKFRRFSHQL